MSEEYWEHRYRTHDMPWEKGAPSPGLVDFLAAHPELKRGTVCVPGCGLGHDARELAKHGFEVSGFDLAPSAINIARGTPASNPACLKTGTPKFFLANFLRDEPPQRFDWIFEHTLFCAIQPAERDDYVRAVLKWLKPGGNYLAVNYFDCGPDGPPFPTTRTEQLERLSPHFELVADWTPRSYPSRENRERIFWWRRK